MRPLEGRDGTIITGGPMANIEFRLVITDHNVIADLRTDEVVGRTAQKELRIDGLTRKQIEVYERQLSRGVLTGREELEVLGEQLYRTLFDGGIAEEFEHAVNRSSETDSSVYLILEFEASAHELARLPWEYLYNPMPGNGDGYFLAFRNNIAIARRAIRPRASYTLTEPPLRVLFVTVDPPEANHVALDRISSLQRLQDDSTFHLRILEQADFSRFVHELNEWSPHIVHYSASTTADGKLAFSNPGNGLQGVDVGPFAEVLEPAGVRVLVLESIEASLSERQSREESRGTDFRQTILQLGSVLPSAVVANQFPLTGDARRAFFDKFYSSISEGAPVIEAVQRGRIELRYETSGPSFAAFGAPIVYLQGVSDAAVLRRSPERIAAASMVVGSRQYAQSDRQTQAPTAPPQSPTAPSAASSAPPPGAAATGEAVGVVPNRLPPDGDALVWREAELEHLLSILRRAGSRGRKTPPIVVVAGEPGMGKTFLAVHGAHRLRDQFPDGTLFITLGGPSRQDTARALRTALQDLEPEQPNETEPADAAASLEQLASRYRTAFSGRRILVLVDDALEASDAEPFIPPNPSSALVVTSPSPLRLPKAQLLSLSPVQNDEVARRLKQVLETRGVELSDELLARVMAVTEGNPLAVSLVEAILREAPPQRVMLSLEAEQRAIEEASSLVAGDVPEEVHKSYRMLDSEAQRLFRLLGLLPNSDFEAGFAAAVLDTDESIAHERLDLLIDADLVGRSKNGRYSLPPSARAATRYQFRAEEPPSERGVAAVRAVRWLTDHPQEDLLGDERGKAERAGAWRAGYASDTVPSDLKDPLEDHLDMEQEVEAISWVVTATDIDPPLSVGLFGDWGTGKSYFMRLMEQCVGQIAATARHEHEADRDFPACSYIRQITFNAWHYVDANLWASLVTHIFEELAKPEPETPQAEQEVANLLERLQTTQVLRQEAEAKKASAGEERRRRTSELEQVKRRRMAQVKDLRRGQVDRKDLLLDEDIRDRAATLAEETPAAARRHVQETTAADLLGDMAEIAGDQSFLREFVELIPDEETRSRLLAFVDDDAVRAGFSKLAADPDKVGQLVQLVSDPQFREKAVDLIPGEQRQQEVADLAAQVTEIYTEVMVLRQVAADVRTTWGKFGYFWEALRDRKPWKRKGFVISAIILAAGVGLSAFFITSQGWTLKGILPVLVSVAACLRVAVPLVQALVSRVKRTVDLVADAMDDSARRQIASLEAQEAQLQGEIEEARLLELEAERELEDIRRGRRLYQYIQERASSTDYQQYLGVIALIRKDFERLAELMDEGRRAREGKVKDRAQEAGSEVQAAGNGNAVAEEEPSDGLPQIDRIILYVDDLDRCPAKRVVEVLEAVHLLLALKLFVVVVGVDSRWLVRSLRRHYQAQLSADEGIVPQRQDDWAYWDTTPQNYLEKIFQIVFSIRSMGRIGYESLLEALFPGTRLGSVNVEESTGSIDRTHKDAEAIPASVPRGIQPVLANEGTDLVKPVNDAITDLADPLASPEETQSTSTLPKTATASAAAAETSLLAPHAEAASGSHEPDAGSVTAAQTVEPKEQENAEGGNATQGPQPKQLATPPREALQITSEELNFMKMLVRFVPTPRSAKRLANTYRLMRVLVTADEVASFRPGHDDTGDYKIALALLAILVGFPNQAPFMFRQLLEAENTNWSAFRSRLAAELAETDHIDADGEAEPKRSGKNDRPESPARRTDRYERGRPDYDDPETWERLLQYLDKLTKDAGLPAELGPYQYWCRRVARFSFQTGRLAAIIRTENDEHRHG